MQAGAGLAARMLLLHIPWPTLAVPRPTAPDTVAVAPQHLPPSASWRSAAATELASKLSPEGNTGITTVDLKWITAGAANCTHAATCLTEIPTEEWDRLLAEQRYLMQTDPPTFICDNVRQGFLTYISRECSPAENATGGTGQLLNHYPELAKKPFKTEALYCGNPIFPWAAVRADKVDKPVFDMCHSTKPGGAYMPNGVCGRHSSREMLMGVMLLREDQATAARIGLFGLDPMMDVYSNVSIGLMNGMQAAVLDCIGGWVDASLFECQHCPGSCNDDLPGGYEWSITPSSFDGSTVYDRMFMSTPEEYVEYACKPPFWTP